VHAVRTHDVLRVASRVAPRRRSDAAAMQWYTACLAWHWTRRCR